MARAFEDVFSVPDAFHNVEMPGRTDSWILSDALTAHGVPFVPADLERFQHQYLRHLEKEIEQPGPRKGVMPGVRALLDILVGRHDVFLALLTGNYEDAARTKLEYFDLWRYFRCGAFGDSAPDRNGLLPKVIATIRTCGGPEVASSRVVVVGDTPLDVACAAASGARSLAVATGSYDTDALRAAGADVVMKDLGDTRQVLRALQIPD
jgi:phosphoglycolate phosphatase